MDPPTTSSNQSPSENSHPSVAETSKDLKEATEQTSELRQRNSQETSKEAEKQPPSAYKLGADTDNRTELQKYDDKQKFWIMLYICWLAWNIFSALPDFAKAVLEPLFSLKFGRLVPNLIFALIRTCPYWIQLWGIYKRSLKATNRAIKILGICLFFVAFPVVFSGFFYFYADSFYALVKTFTQILQEQAPDHPSLQQMRGLPPLESWKEVYGHMLRDVGIIFAYFVAGYFAARKYRNYLNQRQKILLKKNE